MKRLNLLLITVLCIFASTGLAQEKEIVFEQITNESGRSLGFITGIVQDETGFMWFATRSGLYRYNGYSYKLFKKNNDSLSLKHNDIAYLYYDNNKTFWMRHYDELSVFKDEQSLYAFDSITSKSYDIDVKIVQDKRDNYWIGPTGKGVIKYNPKNNTTINFHCPQNTYTPKAWSKIESLLLNNETTASITEPGNETDTTVYFTIDKKDYYLIASSGEIDGYGKYDFGSLYLNDKLIWELSDNKSMWCGGEDKNVFEVLPIELDPGKYQLKYKSDYTHSCQKWDGSKPDKINFCGATIVKINATDYKSISNEFLQPYRDSTFIKSELIKDIIIDNTGNFWALTEKGLEKYNYRRKIFEHFPIDFEELLGIDVENEYLRIYQDKKGIFWISSMYGLIKYNQLWGKFVIFQNTDDFQVLTSNTIFSVFEDNNSQIWIGTDKGINIYNPELNTVEKITANNHNRLYHNKIYDIFEDRGGNIWIATAEGLNRLIKNQFTYTNLNFVADNNYPVVYDDAANIWYALNNKVGKFSRTLLTNEDYILPDYLFNNNEFTGEPDYLVNDMVVNSDRNIWIATDNKISRLNIFSNKVDFVKTAGAIIIGSDSIKNSVKKLLAGKASKIYAFCPNGMYIINSTDLITEDFFPFPANYDFIEEVDINYFKNARLGKKGNVWIRTSSGLFQFNVQQKKLNLIFEFDDEFKRGPLSKGKIDFDKFGNVWFATLPYLFKLNIETLETEKWVCEYDHDWATGNVKVGNKKVYIYGSNGLYSFDT